MISYLAQCSHVVVDLLEMATAPEVKMKISGPDRWRGTGAILHITNGYRYFYRVPSGFADGTAEEVSLDFMGSFKWNRGCNETIILSSAPKVQSLM